MPNLHIRRPFGQLPESVSKSVARSSRFLKRKIWSNVEGQVCPRDAVTADRTASPYQPVRMDGISCLADMDHWCVRTPRPFAAPYRLRLVNPDPEHEDFRYSAASVDSLDGPSSENNAIDSSEEEFSESEFSRDNLMCESDVQHDSFSLYKDLEIDIDEGSCMLSNLPSIFRAGCEQQGLALSHALEAGSSDGKPTRLPSVLCAGRKQRTPNLESLSDLYELLAADSSPCSADDDALDVDSSEKDSLPRHLPSILRVGHKRQTPVAPEDLSELTEIPETMTSSPPDEDSLTLCEREADSEDGALLARVILVGLMSQRARGVRT